MLASGQIDGPRRLGRLSGPFRSIRGGARYVGNKAAYNVAKIPVFSRAGERKLKGRAEFMSFSSSIPDVTDDWGIGATGESAAFTAGHRARAHAENNVAAISQEGVRKELGILLIALFCFVLGVLTLLNVSNMMTEGKNYSRIQDRVKQYTDSNDALEERVAAESKSINVGYEAVAIGMINAKGVKVISLSVPDNAVYSEADVNRIESEHLATILGD